jgi:hypothetical protein
VVARRREAKFWLSEKHLQTFEGNSRSCISILNGLVHRVEKLTRTAGAICRKRPGMRNLKRENVE